MQRLLIDFPLRRLATFADDTEARLKARRVFQGAKGCL